MSKLILKACILLIFSTYLKGQDNLVRPANTIVGLGENQTIHCSFRSTAGKDLYWRRNNADEISFDSHVVTSDYIYEIEKSQKDQTLVYDLKVVKASFGQASWHYCTCNTLTEEDHYVANLIVLDKNITCCVSTSTTLQNLTKTTASARTIHLDHGDTLQIICPISFESGSTCHLKPEWTEALTSSLMSESSAVKLNATNKMVSLTWTIGDDFPNGTTVSVSVGFECKPSRTDKRSYDSSFPKSDVLFTSPVFFLKEKGLETTSTTLFVPALSSTSGSSTATVRSGASESDPAGKGAESSTVTLTMVVSGIVVFFTILVAILVVLLITKYRKKRGHSGDRLTAYPGGCSTMTENVVYKRQPVSCENSYNIQANNLTPPPQTGMISAFQSGSFHLAPSSTTPLMLGHQYHREGPNFRFRGAEDSEVYDRIDDNNLIQSTYIHTDKRMQQPPLNSQVGTPKPLTSPSQPSLFRPALPGYTQMNSFRAGEGYLGHHPQPPLGPSPACFPPNDPGVYLVPNDKEDETHQ